MSKLFSKKVSFLNNAPLRELLNQILDFNRIDNNIARGYLSSVSITASSYSNGDSISFYQSNGQTEPWSRIKRRGEVSQLNTEHLMASAAIPMIFPSVKIKNQHLGDGSIHQLPFYFRLESMLRYHLYALIVLNHCE